MKQDSQCLTISRNYHIGYRFLRHKYSPWWTLALAPLKLLCSSGHQHIYEKIRYLRALGKIDFLSLYRTLNDLLW